MVVTKIRKKSFDVDVVSSGERYGVDRDGYTIQSFTCLCTEKISTELREIIEAIKNPDSEVTFLEYRDLLYRKHAIINGCRKTNIKKVRIGYNG